MRRYGIDELSAPGKSFVCEAFPETKLNIEIDLHREAKKCASMTNLTHPKLLRHRFSSESDFTNGPEAFFEFEALECMSSATWSIVDFLKGITD